MKICRKCGQELPETEFNKKVDNKTDGLQSWCKNCFKVFSAKYDKTDAGKARTAKHAKTDKRKISIDRSRAKRRGFGFIAINSKQYLNDEWHHLHLENNHDFCLAIPDFIHKRISHSSMDNINMDEINSLAIQYWMDSEIYSDTKSPIKS